MKNRFNTPCLDVNYFRKRIVEQFSVHSEIETETSTIEWGQKYLPMYYTNEPSSMHEWVSELLDSTFPVRGVKAVVIGPRGGAKSTTCTFTYALKQAVEGKEKYIILISDTEGQACSHLENIKDELEANIDLRRDYPYATGVGPVWQKAHIQLNNGVVIQAFGTGSRIRGRRVKQFRPSLIILDDVENDSHIESNAARIKVKEWFNRTVFNMGNAKTNFFVVGTSLHKECLITELTARAGWETKKKDGKPEPFRAIEKWPKRMDLWDRWEELYCNPHDATSEKTARRFYLDNKKAMDLGHKILWADKDNLYALMQLRAEIGHRAFLAEMQGNPINPEVCEWEEEYFTHDTFWIDSLPENLVLTGVSIDPSKGKDGKKYDYSSICYGGIDARGHVYVDFNLEKRSADKIVADGLTVYEASEASVLILEVNQFQSLFEADFKEEAEERNLDLHIVPIDNRVNKNMRIRRLSPLLSQKRIHVVRSAGSNIAVNQLKDFPVADHDDGPDSLEMFTRILFNIIEENQV